MNYPKGIKQVNNNSYIKYDNRGMGLESDINLTNQYYVDKGIAYIYKKPTPIQVTKVDYKNSGMVIKEAFFKEPSTTDYNGLYNGMYIDFEAKETNNAAAFPLANIHMHQIEHIRHVIDNGGIGFVIVRFTKLNKTYILFGKDLVAFVDKKERKSIPISYFDTNGHIVKDGFIPRLDYLSVIKEVLGGCADGKKEKIDKK